MLKDGAFLSMKGNNEQSEPCAGGIIKSVLSYLMDLTGCYYDFTLLTLESCFSICKSGYK